MACRSAVSSSSSIAERWRTRSAAGRICEPPDAGRIIDAAAATPHAWAVVAGGRSASVTSSRNISMADTLFGKIIRREIPADIVFEDDEVLAFRDINPQAPVHVLFIPKKAVATLNELGADNAAIIGQLFLAATGWAKQQGFAEDGYRLV